MHLPRGSVKWLEADRFGVLSEAVVSQLLKGLDCIEHHRLAH